eukprot:TRINITY_DN6848_c0_g1_i5.p1 TRINITY_DN6848_c0_g1~~TRINITY_DN6848_c0_g1_i5.p1  ORF type:complete len:734 (+),score=98.56 TRINITY_DN6848_c0_g1_i5:32-2203(+)
MAPENRWTLLDERSPRPPDCAFGVMADPQQQRQRSLSQPGEALQDQVCACLRYEIAQLKDWLTEQLAAQLRHQERLLRPAASRDAAPVSGGMRLLHSEEKDRRESSSTGHMPLAFPGSVNEELSVELAVSRGPTRSGVVEVPTDAAELTSKFMDLFDALDLDGSGSLNRTELRHALISAGIPPNSAMDAFTDADSSGNEEIDRMEWLHLIQKALNGSGDNGALLKFAQALIDAVESNPEMLKAVRRGKFRFIIFQDSTFRTFWDLTIMMLLLYILLSLPFSMGFEQLQALAYTDSVSDLFFLVDIVINFRTTYIAPDEVVVTSGMKIAWQYMKTWFLLDLVSSVPWDILTSGLVPSLQVARLLKVGKIAKLLRVGKLFKTLATSEMAERLEDFIPRKAYQNVSKILALIFLTILLCHWLACFLAIFDSAAIDNYLGGEQATERRYLAALYWSMTTLTTVGRVFAMVAMLVGGAFYGFILGNITSVVTSTDIDSRAFNERMEMLEAWLEHHDRIPQILRRRIRRNFKAHWYERTTADDSSIICDLSRELRADAAFFILNENVRSHHMFRDLHSSALATLVDVLKQTSAEHTETIVNLNDPGTAMYIIAYGSAQVVDGDLSIGKKSRRLPGLPVAPSSTPTARSSTTANLDQFPKLHPGDSFGEEIIFGIEELYTYTILAISRVNMFELGEDEFKHRFKNLPDLRKQMLVKFEQLRNGSSVEAWT